MQVLHHELRNQYRNDGFRTECHRCHLVKGERGQRSAIRLPSRHRNRPRWRHWRRSLSSSVRQQRSLKNLARRRCAVKSGIQIGDQGVWTTADSWTLPRRSPGNQIDQSRVGPGVPCLRHRAAHRCGDLDPFRTTGQTSVDFSNHQVPIDFGKCARTVHSPSHEEHSACDRLHLDFVDWSNTRSKQGDHDRHISLKEGPAACSCGDQKTTYWRSHERPFALVVNTQPLARSCFLFHDSYIITM